MAVDQKIELELALRDSVSLALKTIADNLDAVNRKLTRGGEELSQGGDSLQKIAKNTKDIGETAKQTSRHLVGLGDSLIKIGGMLTTGPVAIGAGIVATVAAVGSKLKEFADERLRLKALSEDTGLSEDKISIMMQTQARMAINPAAAEKNIEHIGGALKQMTTARTGSALFQALSDMGEAKFAKELLATVESGNFDKAVDMIVDEYERLSTVSAEAATFYATRVIGVNESFLQNYKERSKGLVPAYRMNLEAAQSWADRWGIVHENLRMMWNVTIGNLIWGLIRGEEILEGAKVPGVTPVPGDPFYGLWGKPAAPSPGGGSQDAQDLKDSKKESSKYLDDIQGALQRMYEKGRALIGRAEGGPVEPGRTYLVGERGPELFHQADGSGHFLGEEGPMLFRPKKGGNIISDPFFNPSGSGTHPRDPMSSTEENYDALQRALNSLYGIGAGRAEGEPGGPSGRNLFGDPLAEDLKFKERDMEKRLKMWSGESEDAPPFPRGGTPGDFYNRWTGEAQGQPINFRGAIDSELGGVGGGSLNAEIVFRNVPPGVRTSADGDGFDNFTVNKTRQLEQSI